jgi:chorismate mutase
MLNGKNVILGVTGSIAAYKAENHLPVLDREREQAILNRLAAQSGEDAEAVQAVYAAIFQASRDLQQQINRNE